MKKKERKKTPVWFLAVVIAAMLIVFTVQNLFPTNLGKVYGKYAETAAEITVMKTAGDKEKASFHTESEEEIMDFGRWAGDQTMRDRSLADSVRAGSRDQVKYSFAIKDSEGHYSAITIDDDGFVHVGAQLYKLSGNIDKIIQELDEQLASWKTKE